ncbi:nicotinate phosphoribosyltransferase-like isoform X3 [Apostichopus japonicus]|uniref:nicotinate phosphoribosyltransferase-like isoform X3 n=1 Tax=Stichopus japonicus TaxID=307972 RepID=UPI003AB4723D
MTNVVGFIVNNHKARLHWSYLTIKSRPVACNHIYLTNTCFLLLSATRRCNNKARRNKLKFFLKSALNSKFKHITDLTDMSGSHFTRVNISYFKAMEANGNSIPTNGVVQSLLTDLYQVTMAYSYWKNGQQNCHAVFDVFFRKNPFDGEFTIFAGLGEVLKLLRNLKYSESDIDYLKTILPANAEQEFFDYLSAADGKGIKLYSVEEGTVVFPREPLIRVEGPLPLVQLLETTILNLVNYASLVATNAARFRIAAGEDKKLLEFGLRRAQGPDGGLSASKYCYVGGFDGTSNVLAGKLFGIPVSGTHAHSYVMAHTGVSQLAHKNLSPKDRPSESVDFLTLCQKWKERVCQACRVSLGQTNDGELASYISYSLAFPNGFLALLDTYDILRSGLPNFCTVALALHELGYKAMGVRIDSGDLAYLSKEIRKVFHLISREFNVPWFADLTIVASNDIDEETLLSLNQQGHSIDAYGIGTHLVTCRKQPSLGVVFKLVQVDELARIKLSQDLPRLHNDVIEYSYLYYWPNCSVEENK